MPGVASTRRIFCHSGAPVFSTSTGEAGKPGGRTGVRLSTLTCSIFWTGVLLCSPACIAIDANDVETKCSRMLPWTQTSNGANKTDPWPWELPNNHSQALEWIYQTTCAEQNKLASHSDTALAEARATCDRFVQWVTENGGDMSGCVACRAPFTAQSVSRKSAAAGRAARALPLTVREMDGHSTHRRFTSDVCHGHGVRFHERHVLLHVLRTAGASSRS